MTTADKVEHKTRWKKLIYFHVEIESVRTETEE